MDRKIEEIEFTVFDTETTGLEPESGDRIVEIAAIRFKDGEKIATFQTLVNPHRFISEAAFEVNQITADMLKDAPSIEMVMPNFLAFIQNSCLCSYNVGFDIEFLNHELKMIGRSLPDNVVILDILKMAKRLLPNLERYALWFVADRLGIKVAQRHRALSDTELAFDVFYKLNEILKTKGILDFVNFSQLFGLNSHFLVNTNNQKIAKIQEAIDLGVKLKLKYFSRTQAEVTEREVIPKEIRQERNQMYFIGYCYLRNEERSFRIDGILHLEIV